MVLGRLPRNESDGKFIAQVEALGYVPPCVRDAFSWLPHPYVRRGRGRRAEVIWFWELHDERPPTPQEPPGSRCSQCVFQEPRWSQGYAGCSHSWLHDRDEDCRAFYVRDEILARFPSSAGICRPPNVEHPRLLSVPYWSDGSTYADFHPSCNLPSAYYAWLNWRDWWMRSGGQGVYAAIDRERLRRFWQWAEDESIRQIGFFQGNLFISAFVGKE